MHIFISYSRKNQRLARQLAAHIAAAGFDVWLDDALTSGEAFREQIANALENASVVIALWTPAATKSEWVRDEALNAAHRGRLLSLIRGGGVPDGFPQHTVIDMTGQSFSDFAGMQTLMVTLAGRCALAGPDAVLSRTAAWARQFRTLAFIVPALFPGLAALALTSLIALALLSPASLGISALDPIGAALGAVLALVGLMALRQAYFSVITAVSVSRRQLDRVETSIQIAATPTAPAQVDAATTPMSKVPARAFVSTISGNDAWLYFCFDPKDSFFAEQISSHSKLPKSIGKHDTLPRNLLDHKNVEKVFDYPVLVVVLWSKEAIKNQRLLDIADLAQQRGRLFSFGLDETLPPIGLRQTHVTPIGRFLDSTHIDAIRQQLHDRLVSLIPIAKKKATGKSQKGAFTKQTWLMLFVFITSPLAGIAAGLVMAGDVYTAVASGKKYLPVTFLAASTTQLLLVLIGLSAFVPYFAIQLSSTLKFLLIQLGMLTQRGANRITSLFGFGAYLLAATATLYVLASVWFQVGHFAWTRNGDFAEAMRWVILVVFGVGGTIHFYGVYDCAKNALRFPPLKSKPTQAPASARDSVSGAS